MTLAGEHAELNLCGMAIADKNQHVDNYKLSLADGAPLAFVQFPPETLLYQQMQTVFQLSLIHI